MRRQFGLPFSRPALAAATALALLVSLAACAPATTGKPHVHLGSGGNHSAAPTPTPLAPPVVRINQTCSQLVSASALATAIGKTIPAVTPPAEGAPDVRFTQAGALTCNWSDNYANDAQQDSNHLVAWVLPDVSPANWAEALKTLTAIGETKTTLIDGTAYAQCGSAASSGSICTVDTLVGTTWLSFEVQSLTKSFATIALATAHFASLLNPIITAASTSSFVNEPKWADPAATTTPTTCAALTPNSEITAVSGATGISAIGPDLSDQESLASFWGVSAGLGEVECDLASSDQQSGFFSDVIPGGGWAWHNQQTFDSTQLDYATVPSLGTQAVEYQGDAADDSVTIDWVRGGNLCSMNVALPNKTKQAAVALALATYINTQIPG